MIFKHNFLQFFNRDGLDGWLKASFFYEFQLMLYANFAMDTFLPENEVKLNGRHTFGLLEYPFFIITKYVLHFNYHFDKPISFSIN